MELHKVGGIWHVTFTGMNGRSQTRSTKTSNREDAEVVVEKAGIKALELAAKAKSLTGETLTAIMAGRKVTADTALAEWKEWRAKDAAANTVRTQGIIIQQWINLLGAGSWGVSRLLTEDHIDAFVNEKGASRSLRDLRLASLRSLTSFCSARAYIVGNPSKNSKVRIKGMTHEQREQKPRVPVTEAEFKKLVATAGEDTFWKHAVPLSYWTGLRISDICCLEWASITGKAITLWTQKTQQRVVVPFSEPLIGSGALAAVILEMMMNSGGGRYCFPEERAVILDPDKRAKLSVYGGRLFQRAGVEGKSFHCLRHSFATRLHKAGKTLEEIGEIVGHSNTATTKGYTHD